MALPGGGATSSFSWRSGIGAAHDAPGGAVVPDQHLRGAAAIRSGANGGLRAVSHDADHAQRGWGGQVGKGYASLKVELALLGLEGIEGSHLRGCGAQSPV